MIFSNIQLLSAGAAMGSVWFYGLNSVTQPHTRQMTSMMPETVKSSVKFPQLSRAATFVVENRATIKAISRAIAL